MVTNSEGLPSEDKVLDIVLTVASAIFDKPVSETDNFFDLGGDSQSAVDLGSRLEQELHAELFMEVLLNADDMRGLAEGVVRSLGES